ASSFISSVGASAGDIDAATHDAENDGRQMAEAGQAVSLFVEKLKGRCAVLLRRGDEKDWRMRERLPCHLDIEIETRQGRIKAPVYEISLDGILICGPQ